MVTSVRGVQITVCVAVSFVLSLTSCIASAQEGDVFGLPVDDEEEQPRDSDDVQILLPVNADELDWAEFGTFTSLRDLISDPADVEYYDDDDTSSIADPITGHRPGNETSGGDEGDDGPRLPAVAEITDTGFDVSILDQLRRGFGTSACPRSSVMHRLEFEARLPIAINDYPLFIRQFHPRLSVTQVHTLVRGACIGFYHGFLTYNATIHSSDRPIQYSVSTVEHLLVIHPPHASVTCYNDTLPHCTTSSHHLTSSDTNFNQTVLVLEMIVGDKVQLSSQRFVRHSQCVCVGGIRAAGLRSNGPIGGRRGSNSAAAPVTASVGLALAAAVAWYLIIK